MKAADFIEKWGMRTWGPREWVIAVVLVLLVLEIGRGLGLAWWPWTYIVCVFTVAAFDVIDGYYRMLAAEEDDGVDAG